MGEELTYSPEQWVEHYQGDYLKTMTIETAGRIIKSDMTNVARSCVSVGFHLKAIRDRELFRDAGYDTLWDYAADQFGISKSSASRYMEINDRFSIGGNTPMLQKEYKDFSKSQLQEMISLSPEQARKVTAKTTVKQIREMKPKKEKPNEVPAVVIDPEDTSDQCSGQVQVGDYPSGVPKESVATSQQKKVPDTEVSPRHCITGKSKYGFCNCCGYGGAQCCNECSKDCNVRCGWLGEQQEEPQESIPEIVEYDRSTLKRMIKDTESALELMRDYWMQNQPLTYAKHTMQLQAYKMFMEYNDQFPIVESQEQPQLPLLKNNDQRKEWLQNYQSWGLWYEDKNIGCRYYKYDFECGAKLIVSEYDNHSPHAYSPVNAYFHLIGGPKPPRGKYGETKWVHHDEYIPASDHITGLAEFLKEIQKNGEK
ncbi:MAG: hypothetical protein MR854_02050 [Clostridiaceae bacterium]|nr:hypothetical protein [Clostridiaceae bacterium]